MTTDAISETYGREYYADNHRNRVRYEALADAIAAVVPPAVAAWDIGCGAGLLGEALGRYGVDVHGVDGSRHARARVHLDLTAPGVGVWPCAPGAICLEVAEHLPSRAADNLVRIVSGAACEWIVWSAAHPGQGGTGHVNEQPPAYWLEKFEARGWAVDALRTKALRVLMHAWHTIHEGYADNVYVLRPAAIVARTAAGRIAP